MAVRRSLHSSLEIRTNLTVRGFKNLDPIGSPWIPVFPLKNLDRFGRSWVPAFPFRISDRFDRPLVLHPLLKIRNKSAVRGSLHSL